MSMYEKALDRTRDAVGLQYHLANLINDASRADVLLNFASSNKEVSLLG